MLLITLFMFFQDQTSLTYEDALKSPKSHIKLDLSSEKGMTEIPSTIALFENLQVFKIKNSKIHKISPEIGKLAKLKNLIIGNHLEQNTNLRILPDELRSLKSVEYLDLSGLPNLNFSHTLSLFRNAHNLKIIAFMNNDFSDFSASLHNIKSVRWVFFGKNPNINYKKLFTDLERLPIERIGFASNHLKKIPDEIIKLKSLKSIYLVDNQLTKLKILEKLPKLNRLLVDQNKLKEFDFNPEHLELLSLGSNPELSISSALNSIMMTKKLTYLDISNIKEIPEEYDGVENQSISTLNLSSNKLTFIPKFIYKIKALKKLIIIDNKFTQQQVEHLKRNLLGVELQL